MITTSFFSTLYGLSLSLDHIADLQQDEHVHNPILASYIADIGAQSAVFLRAPEQLQNDAGKEICRTISKIRLEIGELPHLDNVSRGLIASILTPVIEKLNDSASRSTRISSFLSCQYQEVLTLQDGV